MKPFHYMLIACGMGVLICGAQARAQDASTDPQGGAYGQLSSLISQITLLKAQLQVVQLKQQIAASARQISDASQPVSSPLSRSPIGVLPPPPQLINKPQAGAAHTSNLVELEPHILSIAGQGGQLSALLLMPGGGEVEVVPGTLLGDGSVVKAVSPQSVRVMQNGALVALPFAGTGGSSNIFMSGG